MENDLPAVDLAAPTATSPKLHQDVEDAAIEQYIREAGRFLEEARISPDIEEALGEYGFDDEELSIGMALQVKAFHAYCARHADCPPERGGAVEALAEKVAQARDDFDGFRLVARAAYPAMADRVNLRVMGDVPDDLQRFVNTAHSAYLAANQEPYAAKLARRGYPGNHLAALGEFLDALAWLDAAHEAAGGANEAEVVATAQESAAEAGKQARDEAYIELKSFMKEVKGVARAAFRKQPEILARLGLGK